MSEEQLISRAETLTYISSWKDELDLRQRELYSRLLSGALGSVATIILSVGISLDKLSKTGLLVKIPLGISMFLLLLAAGNIMNCFMVALRGRVKLLQQEREIAMIPNETIPRSELLALDKTLSEEVARVSPNYSYAYVCIALAIAAGVFTFAVILLRV